MRLTSNYVFLIKNIECIVDTYVTKVNNRKQFFFFLSILILPPFFYVTYKNSKFCQQSATCSQPYNNRLVVPPVMSSSSSWGCSYKLQFSAHIFTASCLYLPLHHFKMAYYLHLRFTVYICTYLAISYNFILFQCLVS